MVPSARLTFDIPMVYWPRQTCHNHKESDSPSWSACPVSHFTFCMFCGALFVEQGCGASCCATFFARANLRSNRAKFCYEPAFKLLNVILRNFSADIPEMPRACFVAKQQRWLSEIPSNRRENTMNFHIFMFKKHVGRKVVQNDVEQFEDQLMAKLGLAAS